MTEGANVYLFLFQSNFKLSAAYEMNSSHVLYTGTTHTITDTRVQPDTASRMVASEVNVKKVGFSQIMEGANGREWFLKFELAGFVLFFLFPYLLSIGITHWFAIL
jgi:hypothetical protein